MHANLVRAAGANVAIEQCRHAQTLNPRKNRVRILAVFLIDRNTFFAARGHAFGELYAHMPFLVRPITFNQRMIIFFHALICLAAQDCMQTRQGAAFFCHQ